MNYYDLFCVPYTASIKTAVEQAILNEASIIVPNCWEDKIDELKNESNNLGLTYKDGYGLEVYTYDQYTESPSCMFSRKNIVIFEPEEMLINILEDYRDDDMGKITVIKTN